VEQAELVALRRRARVLEQEVEILRRATAYFAKDAAPKRRSRGSVTLPSTGFP
jgi:transposase-like protein